MHDAERLADLLVANDVHAARELAKALASEHAAASALGTAALDPAEATTAPLRIAALYLMGGNRPRAIEVARSALANDGSLEMRNAVGGIFTAAGNYIEACTLLSQVVAEAPRDRVARQNLATAAFGAGDIGTAVQSYAASFQLAPNDETSIHALMEMCATIGKWVGALSTLERCREGTPPPDVAVALDVANLQMMTLAAGSFPTQGMDAPSDKLCRDIVERAARQSPEVRLAIARALARAGRFMEAGEVLDGITGRRVLTPSEHADVQYMCGLLAERDGYRSTALERYTKAVKADPRHVYAAINATSLLLQDDDDDVLPEVSAVLAEVDPELRAASAALAFNEARYLVRHADHEAARTCLQRTLALAGDNVSLADLAKRALAELGA